MGEPGRGSGWKAMSAEVIGAMRSGNQAWQRVSQGKQRPSEREHVAAAFVPHRRTLEVDQRDRTWQSRTARKSDARAPCRRSSPPLRRRATAPSGRPRTASERAASCGRTRGEWKGRVPERGHSCVSEHMKLVQTARVGSHTGQKIPRKNKLSNKLLEKKPSPKSNNNTDSHR